MSEDIRKIRRMVRDLQDRIEALEERLDEHESQDLESCIGFEIDADDDFDEDDPEYADPVKSPHEALEAFMEKDRTVEPVEWRGFW